MGLKSLSKEELRQGLVARRPDDHKGVYGHALIVGGSRGMVGAAILAARAALRSGAGLVSVAVPSGVGSVVAGAVPAAMTLGLPQTASGVFSVKGVGALKKYAVERRVTTFAIGPGITTQPQAARFVLRVLAELALPAVVDADALNAIASSGAGPRRFPTILTPHPGEMARLMKLKRIKSQAERARAVEALADKCSGVALLKGRGTLISNGARTVVNASGGPALAKGGSGDVLAGLIAGLWAQARASGRVAGDSAFKCAALGAWLHGVAGDLAQREFTAWGASATDLVELLPRAFKAL